MTESELLLADNIMKTIKEAGSNETVFRRHTPDKHHEDPRLRLQFLKSPFPADAVVKVPFELEDLTHYIETVPCFAEIPNNTTSTKEKTVMQAKTVFDLYFKRAYEALDQAEKDKLDQLIEEDENTKLIDKTFKQLNDSLKDTPKDFVGFHLHRAPGNRLHHCTGDTRKKVEEWSERMTKERRHLDRMHEEVEAQLLSCETYEQARGILRTYDIINNAGEMQEYKPF